MSEPYTLRLTDTAEADLAELWVYLAVEASENTATSLISKLRHDYDRLLAFPYSGAPRDHLRPGVRALVHGIYASYYHVTGSEVIVLRVLHGARDIAAIGDKGGFEPPPS